MSCNWWNLKCKPPSLGWDLYERFVDAVEVFPRFFLTVWIGYGLLCQTTSTIILGTITDPTGAEVAGAEVCC